MFSSMPAIERPEPDGDPGRGGACALAAGTRFTASGRAPRGRIADCRGPASAPHVAREGAWSDVQERLLPGRRAHPATVICENYAAPEAVSVAG